MLVRVLGIVVLVAAVAACGSSSHSSTAGPSTSAPSTAPSGARTPSGLSGTSWTFTGYRGPTGNTVPAVAGADATLTFAANGALNGSTGCNSFSGTYTLSGTKLTIELGPMTLIGCTDPKLTAQEHAITDRLPKVESYTLGAAALVLRGAGDTPLLAYARASTTLSGTWQVTGVNNGKSAVESTPHTEALTADFGPNGAFSGFGGCNQLNGEYTTSGSNGLTFGPLRSTLKTCADAVNQLEAQYSTALSHVATYDINGITLTMRDKSGATQVTATRKS